jgi:hypothetical protein
MRDRNHLASDSLSHKSISLEPLKSSRIINSAQTPKHPLDSSSLSIDNLFSGESFTVVLPSAVSHQPITANHCNDIETVYTASSILLTHSSTESTKRQGMYCLLLLSYPLLSTLYLLPTLSSGLPLCVSFLSGETSTL